MSKATLQTSEAETLILEACSRMELHKAGLSREVTDYIINGKNPEVLEYIKEETLESYDQPFGGSSFDRCYLIIGASLFPRDMEPKPKDNPPKAYKEIFINSAKNDTKTLRRISEVDYSSSYGIDPYGAGVINKDDIKLEKSVISGWFSSTLKRLGSLILNEEKSIIVNDNIIKKIIRDNKIENNILNNLIFSKIEKHHKENKSISALITHLRKNRNWKKTLNDNNEIKNITKLIGENKIEFLKLVENEVSEFGKEDLDGLMLFAGDKSKVVRDKSWTLLNKVDIALIHQWLRENFFTGSSSCREHWLDIVVDMPDSKEQLEIFNDLEKTALLREKIAKALVKHSNTANTLNEFKLPPYDTIDVIENIPDSWLERIENSLSELIEQEKQKSNSYSLESYLKLNAKELFKDINELKHSYTHHLSKDIYKNAKLLDTPEANFFHFIYINKYDISAYHLYDKHMIKFLSKFDDLRTVIDYCEKKTSGFKDKFKDIIMPEGFRSGHPDYIPTALQNIKIWPWLSENQEIIDIGLKGGTLASQDKNNIDIIRRTLAYLSCFPTIQKKWEHSLYDYALGTNLALRQVAQKTANRLGIELSYLLDALKSSSKEIRLTAVVWLIDTKSPEALNAIEKALKSEKDPVVKAKLIDALEACGGDITPYFTEATLLQEAALGLKKAPPKSMMWFSQEELPALHYQNGSEVPQDIIYWWAVLAVKLKEPESNDLLRKYLSLLNQDSQHRLAVHVLNTFITEDTKIVDSICKYTGAPTTKINSAIKDKGILALTSHGSPNEILPIIQGFMKQYYVKRGQIESMIAPMGASDDPRIIQFLLAIARSYKTESVQDLARHYVENIAARNHWTQDQLEDRTIQTAGLEHVYKPTPFEFGCRALALQLGNDLKLQILTDQDKVIKSLPQPRAEDDKEQISFTKKWFSQCKAELKTVTEQQSKRFQDAMMIERHWPAAEWLEYLHQHPVMNRLLQRTLWQAEIEGTWQSFRPSDDGEFVTLDDDSIDIPNDVKVRLISANQLDANERDAWRKHLKDYKIKPLFDQLLAHEVELSEGQRILDHHYGWLSDAYSIRGELTKRGYQRGEIVDSGCFFYYYKNITALNLNIIFEFSGNNVPEENNNAAIYGIKVLPLSEGSEALPLAELNGNMLNAIALDYEAMAMKCAYDEDWKSKLPW